MLSTQLLHLTPMLEAITLGHSQVALPGLFRVHTSDVYNTWCGSYFWEWGCHWEGCNHANCNRAVRSGYFQV